MLLAPVSKINFNFNPFISIHTYFTPLSFSILRMVFFPVPLLGSSSFGVVLSEWTTFLLPDWEQPEQPESKKEM
jgi:hypothetical protein